MNVIIKKSQTFNIKKYKEIETHPIFSEGYSITGGSVVFDRKVVRERIKKREE
ncbi:MAG: hypothetical protein KKD69_01745 [Euryarchaeota archaeon]|nr:hypothetical protein [Euryarchaeota archaeon]